MIIKNRNEINNEIHEDDIDNQKDEINEINNKILENEKEDVKDTDPEKDD